MLTRLKMECSPEKTEDRTTNVQTEGPPKMVIEGKQVQIIKCMADDEIKLTMDTAALVDILHDDKVKDTPVVVLSVVGENRSGKSFILNVLMRYLHALENNSVSDWLGDEDQPLDGFEWQHGVDRTTRGVFLWSRPFMVTLKNGEKAAILLMDNQGMSFEEKEPGDVSTVVAISSMISTIQIYNVMRTVRDNHLRELQALVEAGQLINQAANINPGERPSQRLTFLVRDWNDPKKYKFGSEGGMEYLNEKLKTHGDNTESLETVKQHLYGCFEKCDCFLLPHPGLKVAGNAEEEGDEGEQSPGILAESTKAFKKALLDLGPFLLDGVGEKHEITSYLTGSQLANRFLRCLSIFQAGVSPDPVIIRAAIISELNTDVFATALKQHKENISKKYSVSENARFRDVNKYRGELKEDGDAVIEGIKEKMKGEPEDTEPVIAELTAAIVNANEISVLQLEKALIDQREAEQEECRTALANAKREFRKEMEEQLKSNASYIDRSSLEKSFFELRNKYFQEFQTETNKCLMDRNGHRSELIAYCEQLFNKYDKMNEAKRTAQEMKKAQGANSVCAALRVYTESMDKDFWRSEKHLEANDFQQQDQMHRDAAVAHFDELMKDNPEGMAENRGMLQEHLDSFMERYSQTNEENKKKKPSKEKKMAAKAEEAVDRYNKQMDASLKAGPLSPEAFGELHADAKDKAMKHFTQKAPKVPSAKEYYVKELERYFADEYEGRKVENNYVIAKEADDQAKMDIELHDRLYQYRTLMDEMYGVASVYKLTSNPQGDHQRLMNQALMAFQPLYHLSPKLHARYTNDLRDRCNRASQVYMTNFQRQKAWDEERRSVMLRFAVYAGVTSYNDIVYQKVKLGSPYIDQASYREMHTAALGSAHNVLDKNTEGLHVDDASLHQDVEKLFAAASPKAKVQNELNNPASLPESVVVNKAIMHAVTASQAGGFCSVIAV